MKLLMLLFLTMTFSCSSLDHSEFRKGANEVESSKDNERNVRDYRRYHRPMGRF